MKILHYTEETPRSFDGGPVKGVAGRVAVGKADGADRFCMRVFEVDPGGFTPRDVHEWEHEIFFHSGRGEVLRDGQWTPVESGHVAFIPGNEEHQIRNPGEDTLVFACLIPSGPPEL